MKDIPIPESYWKELRARSQAMIDEEGPFDFGDKAPPLKERQVDDLNDLLLEVCKAQEAGIPVEPADDLKKLVVGYVIGDEEWIYITVRQARMSTVSPEVTARLETECDPKSHQWFGRHQEIPSDDIIQELESVWSKEVSEEYPSREEMEEAFGKIQGDFSGISAKNYKERFLQRHPQ